MARKKYTDLVDEIKDLAEQVEGLNRVNLEYAQQIQKQSLSVSAKKVEEYEKQIEVLQNDLVILGGVKHELLDLNKGLKNDVIYWKSKVDNYKKLSWWNKIFTPLI